MYAFCLNKIKSNHAYPLRYIILVLSSTLIFYLIKNYFLKYLSKLKMKIIGCVILLSIDLRSEAARITS